MGVSQGKDRGQGQSKGQGDTQIPVGLERVLYLAATEPAFKRALEADPEGAAAGRGLKLRPSELAMLRAVPPAMLSRHADRVDASPDNLKRRSFLRAVAASAVTVGAADMLGGCKKKEIETMAGIKPRWDGGRDMASDGQASDGKTGDGEAADAEAADAEAGDTLPSPDQGPPSSTGIRPGDAGPRGEK